MSMNIGGLDVQSDPSYRYKMPLLFTKVEGRGNGIKTVIPNMADIARALQTNPAYTTKFFGCELGAQSRFTEKTGLAVVNGVHESSSLTELLIKFIELFILCPSCHLPEINMSVTRDTIVGDCRACGFHGPMPDQTNRVCTFIVKNPPGSSTSASGASGGGSGGSKAERKAARREKKEQRRRQASSGGKDVDAATAAAAAEADGDDDEGGEVVGMGDHDFGADDAPAELDAVASALREHMAEHPAVKDTIAEVGRLRKDKGYGEADAAVVVFAALFEAPDANVISIATDRAALLGAFEFGDKAQRTLLGCVEKLCGVTRRELLPKVAVLLKLLYDADTLDEDAILKWYKKVSKRYVEKAVAKEIRAKAAPFIEWLENAAEESSSDED